MRPSDERVCREERDNQPEHTVEARRQRRRAEPLERE